MARLVPKLEVEEIQNRGERDVARALVQQLPDECVVYHSYPWLRPERHSWSNKATLKEGEADFVVLDPRRGILILEVKGGELEYEGSTRMWQRRLGRGAERITDPFEQARRNMHAIVEEVRRVAFPGHERLPFVFGYAVVFPDCVYEGSVPSGSDPTILLTSLNMSALGEAVRKALAQWDGRNDPVPLEPTVVSNIAKGLGSTFRLVPALSRMVEAQEEQLIRLTDAQAETLRALRLVRRANVTGVAGSGKTLLAVDQARRFAEEGLKTLFACFNRGLANWVASTVPEALSPQLTVRHFHGLCRDLVPKAGMPFVPDGDDPTTYWSVDAPSLLTEAASKLGVRYDAIVVDESQDFKELWWSALRELQSDPENGHFFLFGDPYQNLFEGDPCQELKLSVPLVLDLNCRNTRSIATYCGQVRGIEIRVRPDAPEGQKTIHEVHATPEAQLRRCAHYLTEWLKPGGLEPNRIAVLCPRSLQNSPLFAVSKVGSARITEKLETWYKGKFVLFSTIRAFKGLEADAIILLDLPKPDTTPHFSLSDYYVATSRAKHLLVVLARE